jgi:hypothetical protein
LSRERLGTRSGTTVNHACHDMADGAKNVPIS